MLKLRIKGGPEARAAESTTLVVVVTDALLTKPQAKRLAMIAQTGMARAIYPVHAPLDGDVVFAAATGEKPIDPLFGLHRAWHDRSQCRGARESRAASIRHRAALSGALPAWRPVRLATKAPNARCSCGFDVWIKNRHAIDSYSVFSLRSAKRELMVTFITGRRYVYADVPPAVFEAFRSAFFEGRVLQSRNSRPLRLSASHARAFRLGIGVSGREFRD